MREVTILKRPVSAPGVCGKCGSQEKDWFVDVGLDLDFNQTEPQINKEGERNPGLVLWVDGVFYLCCDCLNSLMSDVERKFDNYLEGNEARILPHGRNERDDVPDDSDPEPEQDDRKPNQNIRASDQELAAFIGDWSS